MRSWVWEKSHTTQAKSKFPLHFIQIYSYTKHWYSREFSHVNWHRVLCFFFFCVVENKWKEKGDFHISYIRLSCVLCNFSPQFSAFWQKYLYDNISETFSVKFVIFILNNFIVWKQVTVYERWKYVKISNYWYWCHAWKNLIEKQNTRIELKIALKIFCNLCIKTILNLVCFLSHVEHQIIYDNFYVSSVFKHTVQLFPIHVLPFTSYSIITSRKTSKNFLILISNLKHPQKTTSKRTNSNVNPCSRVQESLKYENLRS